MRNDDTDARDIATLREALEAAKNAGDAGDAPCKDLWRRLDVIVKTPLRKPARDREFNSGSVRLQPGLHCIPF